MAGLRGPERNEFCQSGVAAGPPRGAGEVNDCTDGRTPVNLFGVSEDGCPKDCSKGLGSREKWALLWGAPK